MGDTTVGRSHLISSVLRFARWHLDHMFSSYCLPETWFIRVAHSSPLPHIKTSTLSKVEKANPLASSRR